MWRDAPRIDELAVGQKNNAHCPAPEPLRTPEQRKVIINKRKRNCRRRAIEPSNLQLSYQLVNGNRLFLEDAKHGDDDFQIGYCELSASSTARFMSNQPRHL